MFKNPLMAIFSYVFVVGLVYASIGDNELYVSLFLFMTLFGLASRSMDINIMNAKRAFLAFHLKSAILLGLATLEGAIGALILNNYLGIRAVQIVRENSEILHLMGFIAIGIGFLAIIVIESRPKLRKKGVYHV